MGNTVVVKKDTRYHASFTLEAGTWLAQIDEIPEVHTFGATLGKAREHVVDALALWLDVPVSAVQNQVVFAEADLPSDILALIHNAIAARELAESAAFTAPQMMGEAAFALVREAHLSMRDAGDILGISHQRVQQLLIRGKDLTPVEAGASKAAGDFTRTLREYLPGGSKDDVGALAAALAVVTFVAWKELSQ